jgi:hypothetical protein
MSALELYLKAIKESRGVEHLNAVRNLRVYLDITPLEDVIKAIQSINDITLLRYLVEAGLKPTLLWYATKQYDILKRRAGGG